MKVRTVAFSGALLLVGLFAVLNWQAFSAPTTLNWVAGTFNAPIGVVMLAVLAILTLLYLVLLAQVEGTALVAASRQSKELEKARKLADSSEESRFSKLEEQLETRFDLVFENFERIFERIENRDLAETVREEGKEVVEHIEDAEASLRDEIRGRAKQSA